MSLTKWIEKGEFVSYGCSFTAPHKMKIAVIPVGYFEGYPRIAGSKKAKVIINGVLCSLLGRVCMNMMVVDVTKVESPKVGDIVTLIGGDKQVQITAEDVAGWSQTINYEVVTRLNPLVERKVVV